MNNIEQQLKDLQHQPDPEWSNSARNRLALYSGASATASSKSLFINILNIQKWMLIGASTLAIIAVVAGASVLVINQGSNTRLIQTLNLSSEEEAKILDQVALSNSVQKATLPNENILPTNLPTSQTGNEINQSITQSINNATSSLPAGTFQTNPDVSELVIITKNITPGNKKDFCSGLFSNTASVVLINGSYQGTSYNIEKRLDSNGNVLQLVYNSDSDTLRTATVYLGGKYAIDFTRLKTTQGGFSYMPEQTYSLTAEDFSSALNTKIVGKEVINNQEYYLIRGKTGLSSCESNADGSPKFTPAYSEWLANTKDYSYKTISYYTTESYSPSDLIYTSTYPEIRTLNNNEVQAALKFELPKGLEVKKLKGFTTLLPVPELQSYVQNLIQQKGLLIPSGIDNNILRFSVANLSDYFLTQELLQPGLYPDGKLGAANLAKVKTFLESFNLAGGGTVLQGMVEPSLSFLLMGKNTQLSRYFDTQTYGDLKTFTNITISGYKGKLYKNDYLNSGSYVNEAGETINYSELQKYRLVELDIGEFKYVFATVVGSDADFNLAINSLKLNGANTQITKDFVNNLNQYSNY